MRRLSALLILTALSCKGSSTPAKETPKATQVPVSEAKDSHEKNPEKLTEATVDALVVRWLTAQNAGDFEAYSSTYAERFTGIKLVGNRAKSFDREHWLGDKERIFEKSMRVERSEQTITMTPKRAIVHFTQTYESGEFKDVGRKQLVIVRSESGLRISRDEMQDSTVLSSKYGLPVDINTLFFRNEEAGGFIVADAPESMADMQTIELLGELPAIAAREVSAEAVKQHWPNLVGSPITVYSGDAACVDTVGSIRIVGGAWLGEDEDYYDEDEVEETEVEETEEQRLQRLKKAESERLKAEQEAEELRELEVAESAFSAGTTYLVAYPTGKCAGEVATLGKTRKTIRAVKSVEDALVASKAVEAFVASPEYKVIQAEFAEYVADNLDSFPEGTTANTPWTEGDPGVWIFKVKNDFVAVVSHGVGGCGAFEGALTKFFQFGARTEAPALVGTFLEEAFAPTAAMDIGADGLIEFLGSVGVDTVSAAFVGAPVRKEGYEVLSTFAWPDFGCPC